LAVANVPRPAKNETTRGLAFVAGAALVWSTAGLVMRLLDDHQPWRTIFWRSLFAVIFMVGYVVASERTKTLRVFRAIGVPGLLLAACFAVASISFVIALGFTSVATTLVIIATTPLFAAMLGWLILREKVSSRTWATSVVAVAAVGLMVAESFNDFSLTGVLVALVIPIVFAFGTVIIRHQRHQVMTPAIAISPLIALSVAAVLTDSLQVTAHDLALLALFGAGQFGAGMVLYSIGARIAPPAQVALVSLLETVLGPLLVWVVVGENPGAATLVGGLIVLAAMVVHITLDLRRPLPPPAA
jgi:drug/metabolite transporter (DMT)-like permease